ncbi:unnamed protein product [Paramecium octaurelia]|uniref:Alpha-type protein kinase domain-containing protein n=1 Tax=Paramecium octaurelia TaxID=43137 RepID=A0A8S1T267_PAROT|nr:unnamed protein product [Paramecium octaurelia]
MNQIRNLKIYCSCGEMNLFQQVCLSKSCKAVNRAYCLKCDKRIEHLACQNNLKDENGLIHFFEDIGEKQNFILRNNKKKFNELTSKLRDKCQYNQQRLQELNESKLKTIIDEIFQFQNEFEKGLEKEIQIFSKEMDTKLHNWIKELSPPNAQQPSISESQEHEKRKTKRSAQNEAAQQLGDQIYRASRAPKIPQDSFEAVIKFLLDQTDFNLDPRIDTIQNKFIFFSVEINQQSFESNIAQIQNIRFPNDYTVIYQHDRSCIRTLKPIAFSKYNEFYLMKIKNSNFQDEVFFLKMPIGGQTYSSMNEAIQDCRSHLISKRFMQKFVSQLNGKGCKTPPIGFSDLLILQENEKSFWIAERLYKGDYVTFNNNAGYINSDDNLLNNVAQVFSIYTYIISKFQYLICNLQGVGSFLTDPIINTVEGNFGETDLGIDGLSEYVISVERFRETRYQKYLDMLDVKF